MSDAQKVVLTAAQPTGQLHLGNYFGAVRHWTSFLDDHNCFFGIVDLHAITMPYTPAELRANTLDCLAQYIACGLDPERCSLFAQSHVPGHTELAWVLSSLTPLGQLERMTQFKDKSKRQGQSVNAGLLYYPVLQAADILLYNADIVPVGEDQKQHLELTRDIAQKFNQNYSDTFVLPEPIIPKRGARIMSLQDPQSKMSKSALNKQGVISLWEPEASIRKKVMSAVTDSDSVVRYDPENKPGVSNLLTLMHLSTGESIEGLVARFEGAGYGDFKAAVADALVDVLLPMQERYEAIRKDKSYLMEILAQGAEAASRRARRMLSKVYRKAGFLSLG
jgi:tryptophanyl-tRNA synthetase